jgi:hypothetical protein
MSAWTVHPFECVNIFVHVQFKEMFDQHLLSWDGEAAEGQPIRCMHACYLQANNRTWGLASCQPPDSVHVVPVPSPTQKQASSLV